MFAMRVWMSLLLLLASVSPACAGATLRLTADRPVVIVVNLVPYTVGDMAPVDVPIKNGREGAQKITVRNLMGQQVWSDTIVVRENTQVTLAWKDRELQVVDRALLKNAAALGGYQILSMALVPSQNLRTRWKEVPPPSAAAAEGEVNPPRSGWI